MSTETDKTITFNIEGMDCGSCVRDIEKAVRTLPGIADVKVSLTDNNAVVTHDPSLVTQDAIFEAVEDAGFDVPR
ncbi:MAG: heavy-metal-associated domain-containing protein [Mesorhizobium sp.]|jgi:copper chaperone|nr:heavy metal-associated domain-containing protein [Mesorhizobium sp.]MBL8577223.1 heavy-metal-associated domain-containing protein [Mesorhizobium sp.]